MNAVVDLVLKVWDLFPWNWYVKVLPWEQGLRIFVGKYTKLLEPGIHWRVPVLHDTFVQSTRRRVSNCDTQTVQTLDGENLTSAGTVDYRIVDLKKLYYNLHLAEDTIENVVKRKIAHVISTNLKKDLTPVAVSVMTNSLIQFGRFGLNTDAEVGLTDFVFAKTYRLITDARDKEGYGTGLDTESERE